MSPKKKTSDVLQEMRKAHQAQQELDQEAFERTLWLVREICNDGLVDDVDPDDFEES
jgi:hypothetical protein